MSARELLKSRLDLLSRLSEDVLPEGQADRLIDDLLHEEAEKVRASQLETPEGFVYRQEWLKAWFEGRDDSANLIDPYAKEG
ncbi:hypothetical protein ABZ353_10810 [Streptomyces niveus]|uniref:hypothetical protein n=1 Tax=Streptomyces niveus TaxID=193462 RepID=UPI0033D41126